MRLHSNLGSCRLLGVLAIGLLCASGCSRYAAPTLSVAQTRVAEATGAGLVVNFDIDAQNSNEVELPLREIRYSLMLDGREVFSGVRSPEATLRRLGTQRFTIPAAVALGAGRPRPTGTVPFVLEGQLSYTAPGQIAQVLFDTNIRRPTVSFREAGTVDLGKVVPEPVR